MAVILCSVLTVTLFLRASLDGAASFPLGGATFSLALDGPSGSLTEVLLGGGAC